METRERELVHGSECVSAEDVTAAVEGGREGEKKYVSTAVHITTYTVSMSVHSHHVTYTQTIVYLVWMR